MKNKHHFLLYGTFGLYAITVFLLTFVFWGRGNWGNFTHLEWSQIAMQWTPFNTIRRYIHYMLHAPRWWDNFAAVSLFGNILLLFPLGFYLPRLNPKTRQIKTYIEQAFLITFSIEVTQFLTLRGGFDVDDLILNTYGAILGFYFFKIFKFT